VTAVAEMLPGVRFVEHLMGMPILVDVRDDDVDEAGLDHVFAWFRWVDATFSTYKDDSEISRLARGEFAHANALPEVRCARIGTVDKFQGQQAPVVFFSMATSSGEDVPRNLEFLLSRNRLNVAVSRAKCLAYVVASPKLLEVGCRSIEQMRMANALCLFVEIAEAQAAALAAP
jgi:hypothetical protein